MKASEYIDELEGLIDKYREAHDKYKKLVESLDREIEMHREYESMLKRIICRLIEGQISEENRKMLLEKFRN